MSEGSWPAVVTCSPWMPSPKRAGLVRVRRGAYVAPGDLEGPSVRESAARARVAALAAGLRTDYWFSHSSAALVWGCWVVSPAPVTHLVQLHRAGHRRDRGVVRHFSVLALEDRAVHDGFRVTSLERTVLDCLASLRPGEALAVADSALRLGVDTDRVNDLLARAHGMRGIVRARAIWPLASALAESAGESLLRWRVLESGLEPPALQHEIVTRLGVFRADFAWSDVRVVVEFDGQVKYGGAFGPGTEALWAEKRRHDAIVEAGWRIVRVAWEDLRDEGALVARLRRAGVPLALRL